MAISDIELGHSRQIDQILEIIDDGIEGIDSSAAKRISSRFSDLWEEARLAGKTSPDHNPAQSIFHERLSLHVGNEPVRSIKLLEHFEQDEEGNVKQEGINCSIFILDADLARLIYDADGPDQLVFRLGSGRYGLSTHEYEDTGQGLRTKDEELPLNEAILDRLAAVLETSDFDRKDVPLTTAA